MAVALYPGDNGEIGKFAVMKLPKNHKALSEKDHVFGNRRYGLLPFCWLL